MRQKRSFRTLRELLLSLFILSVATPLVVEIAEVPSAHAKKKRKKKRKKKKKKNDSKADKSEEKATAGPGGGQEQAELRTTGPAQIAQPFSDKEFDNSKKADKKREEAIEEIKELLPKVKGPQKGELIFRLAELYWQKSRYVYFKEFKKFDNAFQDWVDNGRQGKEPKLASFNKKSEAYKKQALNNYAVVLDKYPDYPRLDEVLYIMAYNEYQAGQKKKAIKNYSKLIRRYPKSEYVADSYLALGEHYFGDNKLDKATKAYTKAYKEGKRIKRPSTYRYAEYKLAWCDYNRQEFDNALKKFKNVVKGSERDAKSGEGGEKATQLKREALNDMVLTYAQLDQVEPAYAYFKKHSDKTEAYRLTRKLAQVFNRDGKSKTEIETYRFLINKDPDNSSAPDFQASIVTAYSKLNDRDAVRKEVRRMVELYRKGSPWYRKNEANKAVTERALALAESRMRELVTEYHRYAQKFKKYDDYSLARDIYADYLKAFNDTEHAYRLSFFYAEILWDLDEWEPAANAYDKVVMLDPKGQYTRTSAWNAILAWEKLSKGEKPRKFKKGETIRESKRGKRKTGQVKTKNIKQLEDIKKGKEYKEKKIPEYKVKLAAACDRYVDSVSEKESLKNKKLKDELIVVKFKSAYIYQEHYHFDEAATRFGELIKRWPDNDYARRGADLILDSYDAREEWENLEKWSRSFAKNGALMKDKKFADQTRKFMEGSTFKAIAVLNDKASKKEKKGKEDEAKGMYAQAADRFDAFVKEFPKSQFAPTALYNSQVIYKKAVKLDLAIASANKLLTEYKKELDEGDNKSNRLEEFTLLNLAKFNEQVANYKVAADTYVGFVDKYKTNEDAPNSLYNAGIFYLGLGDKKSAVKSFARYIKEYKKQKDIPAVYLQMAGVYEDDEDWKRAAAVYGAFEKEHGKKATDMQIMTARYKHASILEKAGRINDMRDACKGILAGWKKVKPAVKKEPIGQLAAGYCAFQVLEPEWDAYKSIKIVDKVKSRSKNLKKAMAPVRKQLDLKKSERDKIAKKYIDILNYGNAEWGVAGLYRAADALLDYVDTLRNAPDPPALKGNFDAIDMFKAELDNIAFPVEDEAIKALEKALAKAFELGIYSEYTLAIEDKLKLFKPSAFGEVREMPFFPAAGTATVTRTAQR
jgi:tetratricopeptide (TPR) repeat protein